MFKDKNKCQTAPGIINSSYSTNDINMYREDEPYLDMFQVNEAFSTPQNVFTMDADFQKITEAEIKQINPLENQAFKQPISVRKNSTLRLDIGLQQVQSTSYSDILNTPEVVKTLTEQESTFNLLDYVFDVSLIILTIFKYSVSFEFFFLLGEKTRNSGTNTHKNKKYITKLSMVS